MTSTPLSDATRWRRGSRILVAEDNAINQKVIQHQLNLLGYVAELVGDGREALAQWHWGEYDLLLTDLNMPHMDGYELTAAIRHAEGQDQHLPIVALTANALKHEEIRCKAVGMDDYLPKPVRLDRLQAMLEKWLPVTHSPTTTGISPLSVMSNPLAVLDTAILPSLIGDDPALIAEFQQDYLSAAQTEAKEIRDALAQGEWRVVGEGAHKLKSSSRSVGAMALGEVCARLEQAGKAVDAEAAKMIALEFDIAFATTVAAINQEGS